jgi:S-DNA-T family DNA segregation ATPase FtsK/SpoIIIE
MGNNDSSNLIDSTAASKLGMHRALLYSEEAGTIEPFRPYSMSEIADF